MAYVSRLVAQGETLIGVSRLHWIFLVQGLLWLIGMMMIGFMIDNVLGMVFGALIPSVEWGFMGVHTTWVELFFLGAGVYIFLVYYIMVATTEIALTSTRIIHKWGWIFVKVKEINIDEIKGSNIDLGMLGRFLGYGKIALDAKFIKDANLPCINKPYRFAKALAEAQDAIEDRMTMVIENSKSSAIHLRPADHVNAGLPDHQPPQLPTGHEPPEDIPPAPPVGKDPQNVKEAKAHRKSVFPNMTKKPEPEDEGQQPAKFEDKPIVSAEQIEKALAGEVINIIPAAVAAQPPQQEAAQPQAAPPQAPAQAPVRKAKSALVEEAIPVIDPNNRPQSEAHPVAEGSYEEEKLKEELIEEWTEHSEDDEDDPYAYRSPRQLH